MSFRFEPKKANNVILFIAQCMNNTMDIQRLFLLLYLADTRHLLKYGSVILGDTYVAMKQGAVPFHVLSMCLELKNGMVQNSKGGKPKYPFRINYLQQLVALTTYDGQYIAESEVECLFEVVHKYKDVPLDQLREYSISRAWQETDEVGKISLVKIAAEHGASTEMINYIEMAYKDELTSFVSVYESERTAKQ